MAQLIMVNVVMTPTIQLWSVQLGATCAAMRTGISPRKSKKSRQPPHSHGVYSWGPKSYGLCSNGVHQDVNVAIKNLGGTIRAY